MKNITLDKVINLFMFLYILSIYLLTYREGLNTISNLIGLLFISLIWANFLLTKRKFFFNKFLLVYLLFLLSCLMSIFIAIDQDTALSRTSTLVLIYLLILSISNYIDTFSKFKKIISYFVYSGFIASIYILVNADFSNATRYGESLGNVNAIGMIIGISTILGFYLLISERNYYIYFPILIINLFTILITGSRKSLLFIVISFLIMFLTQQRLGIKKKIKTFFISGIFITLISYLIFKIPFLYEIIGKRMESLFAFVIGGSSNETSVNLRANMIEVGINYFVNKPITGYGIDNYRFIFGNSSSGIFTYSHNNIIELLVGIGVFGTMFFYLTHILVMNNLIKKSKNSKDSSLLAYTFMSIIIAYIFLSVGLIYYYDKHFSIILVMASLFSRFNKLDEKDSINENI